MINKTFSTHIIKAFSVVIVAIAMVSCLSLFGCSSGSSSNASSSGNNVAPVEESPQSTEGTQSSDAGEMTIHVKMVQAVVKATAQDSPLQFSDEELDVNIADGGTVLNALEATGREYQTSGSAGSLEITSIGGLENGSDGESSHWTYTVNGAEESESPDAFTLQDGDDLTFAFVA